MFKSLVIRKMQKKTQLDRTNTYENSKINNIDNAKYW